MPDKSFEHTIRFLQYQDQNVPLLWLPLVDITLIASTGSRFNLSLLFDTGADVTTLRDDMYPILGLQSWNQGQRVDIVTGGGIAEAYRYNAVLEIFGKIISCPIHLMRLGQNPFFCGLLGRDTVFKEFGFGFWESTHELFVTATP